MLPSPNINLLIYPKSLPKKTAFMILYQKKIGLVFYTATMIYPDIAFAVSWLARFN